MGKTPGAAPAPSPAPSAPPAPPPTSRKWDAITDGSGSLHPGKLSLLLGRSVGRHFIVALKASSRGVLYDVATRARITWGGLLEATPQAALRIANFFKSTYAGAMERDPAIAEAWGASSPCPLREAGP